MQMKAEAAHKRSQIQNRNI